MARSKSGRVSPAFAFDAFAAAVDCCGKCGEPLDEGAVRRDRWARCSACVRAWRAKQSKLDPEELREALDAGLILTCGGCQKRIGHWTRGPVVVIVNENGEPNFVRCITCTRAYNEQKALARVVARVEDGESLPTLLASGVEEKLAVSAVSIVRDRGGLRLIADGEHRESTEEGQWRSA